MGQYKVFIATNWQIGLLISWDSYSIQVSIPFVRIIIGLEKYAKGYYIFGKSF